MDDVISGNITKTRLCYGDIHDVDSCYGMTAMKSGNYLAKFAIPNTATLRTIVIITFLPSGIGLRDNARPSLTDQRRGTEISANILMIDIN